MAQKFHFAVLRVEVTRASRGLSAIAELLVNPTQKTTTKRNLINAFIGYSRLGYEQSSILCNTLSFVFVFE